MPGDSHGRQTRIRRYDQRRDAAKPSPCAAARDRAGGQGNLASWSPAGAIAAMADGNADALEDQDVGHEGLGLELAQAIATDEQQAPSRAPVSFQPNNIRRDRNEIVPSTAA